MSRVAQADLFKYGDFNDDNMLEIRDLALMVTKLQGLSTPVDNNNAEFDLNNDDVISLTDFSLLLTNYTLIQVSGDADL